ncbi:WD40 repeat domain-containing protein [Candidatus Leptofilum sp.]|uniref:WD40 repeat domain-containing protein n=1 Tax=Candidatus Leptofilum sp. TaxID=3241576 RepID=UPI003B59B801
MLIADLETGEILSESALAQFAGNNFIRSIVVNPTGDQAFAIITDVRDDNANTATGVFLSLPAAEVLATVPFDIIIRSARYSPDGTQLAVYVEDQSKGYFTLLDAMTGETIRDLGSRTDGHSSFVLWNSFAFTPDGKRLVSGDVRGVILVWDVETGELIQRLAGHNKGRISVVKVSPDGNTAISAGGGQLRF